MLNRRAHSLIAITLSLATFTWISLTPSSRAADGVPNVNIPSHLYHFGKRDILFEDILADNVPQKAWDEFIMGEKTRFPLKPFRRGLYGSTHPAYAEQFGDTLLEEGAFPWLMDIVIKPECQVTDRVALVSALPDDPMFQEWFKKAPRPDFESNPSWFLIKCYKITGHPRGPYLSRLRNRGSEPQNECESLVHQYYDEAKIAIVGDDAWMSSWYIRDRSCIQEIKGEPIEILKDAVTLPNYFSNLTPEGFGRGTDRGPRGMASMFLILMKSLRDADPAQVAPLEDTLQKRMEESDFTYPLDSGPEKWIANDGPVIVKAYRQARLKGRLAEWNASMDRFISKAVTDDREEFSSAIARLKLEMQFIASKN